MATSQFPIDVISVKTQNEFGCHIHKAIAHVVLSPIALVSVGKQ
jgi:hypothetical protein